MLLTMVGLCVSSAFASGSSASIMDLGWMAGSWSCKVWGGTFEETWLPPVGGTIQGTGRFVSGGRVEFTEFMSIENGPTGERGYVKFEPAWGHRDDVIADLIWV